MTEERVQLFLDALNEDLEFTKKIIPQGVDEMTSALSQKGYDFTKDEVEEMGKIFKEIANKCINEDGELSEEMLEQVAGGGYKVKAIIGIILFVGVGIAVGY